MRHLWPINDRLELAHRDRELSAPYVPYGTAARALAFTGRELVLSGPAGTGKSRACLEKLHRAASITRGFRGLILRKTRESLSEAALFTFEEHVLGVTHPLVVNGPQRNYRQTYRYAETGARIVVGGLDKPGKFMSTEYDMIYVQEATELAETDWLALTTRLRNYKLPYQQLLADCNPDAPTHWLWVRAQTDALTMLHTQHEDNPRLWDGARQAWTEEGREYLDRLDALGVVNAETGQREGATYQRLRKGLWVQAEGLVYDTWSDGPPDGNVTETADYTPGAGPVLWGVDDGYSGQLDAKTGQFTANSHPRVFLLAQQRADGTLCIFAESYAVQALSDKHIADMLALPYALPEYAAVDSSAAELRGRLHEADIATKKATHTVDEGIKETRRRLAADDNGRRSILVHPRCAHLRAELASYRIDPATGKPVKAFDHGPDCLRYLAWATRYDQ